MNFLIIEKIVNLIKNIQLQNTSSDKVCNCKIEYKTYFYILVFICVIIFLFLNFESKRMRWLFSFLINKVFALIKGLVRITNESV